MSYLISNRFKTITTEKIKNSELTKTIEKIKKEIIDAQKSFISNSEGKKILKLRLGQNLNLDKNLSENYYQDIKKIFKNIV
jgi:membrane-associated HD superfamily phosphohydrolase